MKVLDTMQENEKEYPWYKIIEGDSLYQGDFLHDFEVLIPAKVSIQSDQVPAQCEKLDVVIMTQTCDIVQGKVKSLLLCPCWDLWEFITEAKKGFNWGEDQREALRRGNLPGYYLSNEADQGGLKMGLTIVDFHEVYTAPTNVVREFALRTGKRLRLLPPYREHLAQAFARFFMRVGLPVDIAAEKLKTPPT